MAKKKVYAVRKGKKAGIYNTWAACLEQVKGFSGAEYKSFQTMEEAQAYINGATKEVKVDIKNIKEDELVVYVDGSYVHGLGKYSWGMVVLDSDGSVKQAKGVGEEEGYVAMRNVAGEIIGSKYAMKYAKDQGKKKLYLHYDYEGIEKWCTGAWGANKKETQAYKKFYDTHIKNDLEVIFVKVAAHTGDYYNEAADKLAKAALGI